MKFQEPADKPGLTIRTIRKWRKKCRKIGIRRASNEQPLLPISEKALTVVNRKGFCSRSSASPACRRPVRL